MKNVEFKAWLKAAGIRAIRTLAQTAVATIGSAVVLDDVNFHVVISASILSAIISLLTSVAGLPELKVEETEQEVEE